MKLPCRGCAWIVALVATGSVVQAADVILNEYNGVGSTRYLDNDNYSNLGVRVDKQDSYFATIPGLAGDGRVQGNGGNWFELVVVSDHVDMRGWELRWAETDKFENNGSTIWYTPPGGPSPNQGIITLSQSTEWSDLRAGTILTFSELASFRVDTTVVAGNKNFNDFADPLSSDGSYEVTVDLSTDMSFNPAGGDWWLHVSTRDEANSPNPLVTTVTNTVNGIGAPDAPGSFSTGNDNWELTIVKGGPSHELVFGPSGEVAWDKGMNSREVGKLEGNPSTAITAGDAQYKDGSSSTFGQPNAWTTLDVPMVQDFSALRAAPESADFDDDGDADGADFLTWQRGLRGVGGSLGLGDANSDGAIDADDLLAWRQTFGGTLIATAAAVPEPGTLRIIFTLILATGISSRLNSRRETNPITC